MSSEYGELRPSSGCDLLASLGHPCKFQRVSRLCSVAARHSSSGRQPNFAALNRGRHLYSAGRPSRSALAHISSCCCSFGQGSSLLWIHTLRPFYMYFISDGKIRIYSYEKMALKYVLISLSLITRLTNKYRKLVNVIISCFQVYDKASRGL